MRFTRLMAAVGIILLAVSVLAAPANRPCLEDIQKNCPGTVGDRQAMGQCIRENFDKLSEQCQAAVTRRMGTGDISNSMTTTRETFCGVSYCLSGIQCPLWVNCSRSTA